LKHIKQSEDEINKLKKDSAMIENAEKERAKIIADTDEKESNKLKKLAEDEAEQLLLRLKLIEEEEEERQKRRQMAEIES